MISKVENAQISTSLDTLSRIPNAIDMPTSKLFSDYDPVGRGAQLVKAGKGMEVVLHRLRGGPRLPAAELSPGPRKSFETFLITMDDASELFPNFSHSGHEFIYLLKGRLTYRHGEQFFEMGRRSCMKYRSSCSPSSTMTTRNSGDPPSKPHPFRDTQWMHAPRGDGRRTAPRSTAQNSPS